MKKKKVTKAYSTILFFPLPPRSEQKGKKHTEQQLSFPLRIYDYVPSLCVYVNFVLQ